MPDMLAEDDDFQLFVQKMKRFSSIDLSQYKETQMKRRLTTLCVKKGHHTFASYFAALQRDSELLDEFLDRMTINVSEFWRNASRWELVETRFIPELFSRGRSLKCWSAACSAGEEPYTLAMIMNEVGVLPHARILATDLDERALDRARSGVYLDRAVRDIPSHYLNKYFQREQISFHLVDKIKQAVHFQKHNLLSEPFGDNYDLIICRNVMIYFTEEAKKLLYCKFSQALKPGGILFVGSTEQIFSPQQYQLEPTETFFYRKIGVLQ